MSTHRSDLCLPANTPLIPPVIRTQPRPACPVCGAAGAVLHRDVTDAVWGVPGTWDIVRCADRRCGMLWLDPMPIEEDIGLAYQRYQTHTAAPTGAAGRMRRVFRQAKRAYLARRWGYPAADLGVVERALGYGIGWHSQHRARLESSVFHLSGERRGKLLDVGCGAGDGIVRMRALGWDAEGVDLDARAVETASGRGLEVRLGTLIAQRYAGGTFAAIVMNHVIEHVYRPQAELEECFRLLDAGGRLVIETPNAASWLHRMFGSHWRGLEPPRHIQIFTRAALGRLARECGFEIERLATTAKSASFFFGASRAVADARRRNVASEDRFGSWTQRRGAFAAACEVGLLQANPDLGEELVLIARKPPAS